MKLHFTVLSHKQYSGRAKAVFVEVKLGYTMRAVSLSTAGLQLSIANYHTETMLLCLTPLPA